MATIYVRSGAAGANNGTSKTDAYVKLSSAAPNAGDDVLIASDHAETETTSKTYSSGAPGNPVRYKCVDYATDNDATGAVLTNNNSIIIRGDQFWSGVKGVCGAGAVTSSITIADTNGSVTMVNCALEIDAAASGTSSSIHFGHTSSSQVYAGFRGETVTVKLSGTSQTVSLDRGRISFLGGGIDAASAIPTPFFSVSGGHPIYFNGFDLSPIPTAKTVFPALNAAFDIHVTNCKRDNASTWNTASSGPAAGRIFIINSDGANTDYVHTIYDPYLGSQSIDTATYVTSGGAVQDSTKFSEKLTASANASLYAPLRSRRFRIWNSATGSAKTVALETLYDGTVGHTNAQAWIDVEYLGSATRPQSSFATSRMAYSNASPATNAAGAGAAAWTKGSAVNTWQSQKLSASVTPEQKGWIWVTVNWTIANATLYVNPKIAVS